MATSNTSESVAQIPQGFIPVPIYESDRRLPVNVCLLARLEPDPVEGSFIRLRESDDGSAFLGCQADAASQVLEWLEIWVQNPANLQGSPSSYRDQVTNHSLDERWKKLAGCFKAMAREDFIATGWETDHPHPLGLDLQKGVTRVLKDSASDAPWEICRDDEKLQAAGLPPYSTSLTRYLYQPSTAQNPRFIPVTPQAKETESTTALSQAVKDSDKLLPFNTCAGLLMVRRFAPIHFEAYADLLGGAPWQGIGLSKTAFRLGGVYSALDKTEQFLENDAFLFSGAQNTCKRFLEIFHLKLQLFTSALRQARRFAQHQQIPFLNLSADSFKVSLQPVGTGLPHFWTAKVSLVRPSQAVTLPVESGQFRYFLPGKTPHPFIYLPEGIGQAVRGEGTVRIRQLLPPDHGRFIIEGTLVTHEKWPVSEHDLIWIRLPLTAGHLNLYGHLYAAEGMAQGEARFRTIPLAIPEADQQALRSSEGASFARSAFEIVPLLSSPCDLYSLGVMATRTLLVDGDNTLAIALDEILSLARQAGTHSPNGQELKWRISALFETDSRWNESLNPRRLTRQQLEPALAAQLLPMELWWETLAEIVKLFPGMGPDSHCKDFGDAPPLALESVYDEPLRNFEKLLVKTRSLIVIDWNRNREIHSVIEKFRAQSPAAL